MLARPTSAGLIDIVDCCSDLESNDVTRLRDFVYRATESYVSSGPSQISKTKGPIRGLEGGVESIMKSLLQLVDSALAAAAAKSATGAMDGISQFLFVAMPITTNTFPAAAEGCPLQQMQRQHRLDSGLIAGWQFVALQ